MLIPLSHTPVPELPGLNKVIPFGPDDQECFDEVAAVLRKHGAIHRFGLPLLHRHFGLADGEVLVESVDVDNRTLTMRPMSAESLTNGIETAWRLDDQVTMQRCETQCVPERDYQGQPYHNRVHYTTG